MIFKTEYKIENGKKTKIKKNENQNQNKKENKISSNYEEKKEHISE